MMDVAESETLKNSIILNKALLFLIKLNKTAPQSVPKIISTRGKFYTFCVMI